MSISTSRKTFRTIRETLLEHAELTAGTNMPQSISKRCKNKRTAHKFTA